MQAGYHTTTEAQKIIAAEAALNWVQEGAVLGVGSGSTVKHFVEALVQSRKAIEGVVAASLETERQLKRHGVPLIDLNTVESLSVYVDGADQYNALGQLIKGGGGALTREKIIASAAQQFICLVDSSKGIHPFGQFPIAIEVIPMARSQVARACLRMGGKPTYRSGVVTDNGNILLDVHFSTIEKPLQLESELNQIAGVVAHGLFANRGADVLLVGTETGVNQIEIHHKINF